MKVAVWDTYVKKKNGNVMHFDIMVPDTMKDSAVIYRYGKEFLNSKSEPDGTLNTEECQFCHVEEPTEEMKSSIGQKGYFILEMDEIPTQLPENSTRKDIIMHLKAFYPQYRFADFKGKSIDEVKAMLSALK